MVCPNVEESLHNDFLGWKKGPTYYSHSQIMWNPFSVPKAQELQIVNKGHLVSSMTGLCFLHPGSCC